MQGNYANIEINWKKLLNGWVKCNSDGAVMSARHKAACSGVIRDESGAWISGVARSVGYCSVLMAEHSSTCLGQRFSTYIYMEADSTIAVFLITKGCPPSHPCASIVSLTNRLKMRSWQVYRQANQVADWIAN
ncbi:hypothetical protein TSUD_05900 [Trifolium subterraneum]|uniref:RNase H type-1 domain-containing protein n=1 Tax=Trifolium subterraneum TaxID=3900 RepID=A0A2Z6MTA6_TRISU|nr:hypothetical protein TSUD_05900 [Trifolium subterraneum]